MAAPWICVSWTLPVDRKLLINVTESTAAPVSGEVWRHLKAAAVADRTVSPGACFCFSPFIWEVWQPFSWFLFFIFIFHFFETKHDPVVRRRVSQSKQRLPRNQANVALHWWPAYRSGPGGRVRVCAGWLSGTFQCPGDEEGERKEEKWGYFRDCCVKIEMKKKTTDCWPSESLSACRLGVGCGRVGLNTSTTHLAFVL